MRGRHALLGAQSPVGTPLPENLVVRARSLQERDAIVLAPHDEPVPGVGDVALAASLPNPLEAVHPVPTAKLLKGFRGILDDEVDYQRQLALVEPAFPDSLEVP